MLDQCIASLQKHGLDDITVIDNTGNADAIWLGVKSVLADNSYRHLAPWGLELVPKDRPYIVTDDDCAITDDCPDDFIEKMLEVLKRWPELGKVGLGINTANFPDPPPVRYRVSLESERAVAKMKMHAPGVRGAPVDTTFAMYVAGGEWPGIGGVRLEPPYLIEHLPWLNTEYSEEEHAYYTRPDMTTWARTHSAASEVAPKVLVPFTALRSETIVALANSDIPYEMIARPITDDEGYFWALNEAWTPTEEHMVEPFIVVEHDIIVRPETLRELRDCPEDWCAAPYPYLDKPEAWGMGCVKFTDRLIVRNYQIFEQIGKVSDERHPPRHWCWMDLLIWTALTERGEHRHDHPGPPLGHLGHPGKGSSAHGCASV
jgi:hypothetical protein